MVSKLDGLLPKACWDYAMLHLLLLEDQKPVYKRFVYESGRAAFEIGFWFFDSKGASKVDIIWIGPIKWCKFDNYVTGNQSNLKITASHFKGKKTYVQLVKDVPNVPGELP